MSTWYNAGTVSVSNGSATVTGSGTNFVSNVRVGDAIHLPDGRVYEIAGVVSNTELTISPSYLGSSGSGQDYRVQPTRGILQTFYDTVQSWIVAQQGFLDGPLAGRFQDGTDNEPGLSFASQISLGIRRVTSNTMAFVTNGVRRVTLSNNALEINVPVTGTAATENETDLTEGKLLRVNDFGFPLSRNLTSADDLNNTPPGFIGVGSTSNRPDNLPVPGTHRWTGIHLGRNLDIRGAQWMVGITDGAARTWIRTQEAGVWADWYEMYHQNSILGDVSQSGGVPTGAIMQFGFNSNGKFVRFANGVQICWGWLKMEFDSSEDLRGTWTFPAGFDGTADKHVGFSASRRTPDNTGDSNLITATQLSNSSGIYMISHGLQTANFGVFFPGGGLTSNQILWVGVCAHGYWFNPE